MTEIQNPFQSPEAEIYSSELPSQQAEHSGWMWILVSFNGRIPRRYFWGGSLFAGFLFLLFSISLIVVLGDTEEAAIGTFVALVPLMWCSLALRVKRWHDRIDFHFCGLYYITKAKLSATLSPDTT